MPKKKQTSTNNNHPRPTGKEQETQTERDALETAEAIGEYDKARKAAATEEGQQDADHQVLRQRQNIYGGIIRKLSTENTQLRTELKDKTKKFLHIFELLRLMRAEIKGHRDYAKDDLNATLLEFRNQKKRIDQYMLECKQLLNTEREKHARKIQSKEQQIKKLKTQNKQLAEYASIYSKAMEFYKRRMQISQKQCFEKEDWSRYLEEKMKDALFLGENQKCNTCRVREGLQDQLTGDIAQLRTELDQKNHELTEEKSKLAEEKKVSKMLTETNNNLRQQLAEERQKHAYTQQMLNTAKSKEQGQTVKQHQQGGNQRTATPSAPAIVTSSRPRTPNLGSSFPTPPTEYAEEPPVNQQRQGQPQKETVKKAAPTPQGQKAAPQTVAKKLMASSASNSVPATGASSAAKGNNNMNQVQRQVAVPKPVDPRKNPPNAGANGQSQANHNQLRKEYKAAVPSQVAGQKRPSEQAKAIDKSRPNPSAAPTTAAGVASSSNRNESATAGVKQKKVVVVGESFVVFSDDSMSICSSGASVKEIPPPQRQQQQRQQQQLSQPPPKKTKTESTGNTVRSNNNNRPTVMNAVLPGALSNSPQAQRVMRNVVDAVNVKPRLQNPWGPGGTSQPAAFVQRQFASSPFQFQRPQSRGGTTIDAFGSRPPEIRRSSATPVIAPPFSNNTENSSWRNGRVGGPGLAMDDNQLGLASRFLATTCAEFLGLGHSNGQIYEQPRERQAQPMQRMTAIPPPPQRPLTNYGSSPFFSSPTTTTGTLPWHVGAQQSSAQMQQQRFGPPPPSFLRR